MNMKTLNIKWQRLESKGKTCPRCEATGKEIEKAVHSLKQSMAPLGIEVSLEKKVLTQEIFAKDVSQSNRIWIGAKSLEEWLNAKAPARVQFAVTHNAEPLKLREQFMRRSPQP